MIDQRPNARPDRLQYFQPRQVVLHVEHPGDLDAGEVRGLLKRLNRYLKEASLQLRGDYQPGRLTFNATDRASFSLVPVEVLGITDDPDQSVEVLIRLDEVIARNGLAQGGLRLVTAAPNWLAGGAPNQIGTGGPGGQPAKALPPGPGYGFTRNFPTKRGGKWGDGAGVDVAILDTAPAIHDLVQTYSEWHNFHPNEHPLLETLLGPGSPLHVHPATAAELLRVADYSLHEHQYLMADHGLFVAGIIHTLVPSATLHLYEVLNPYGVGDLETIAAGVRRALQQPRRGKLVVNCSLVFNLPRKGHRDPGCLERVRQAHGHLLDRWAAPIEALCLWLQGSEVPLVAAAGNDASRNNANRQGGRPSARYPAAFESVIGVGALPRDASSAGFSAASYSNLSDQPKTMGYATLGGEEGEELGVRGLYIGPFPDGRPNDTKWAWWAGTSFATPIVTGLVASTLSGGTSSQLADIQAALSGVSTQQTPDQEQVLEVSQT